MGLQRRIAVCLAVTLGVVSARGVPAHATAARSGVYLAGGSALPPSFRAGACSDLSGPAFMLCDLFCATCRARSSQYCESLRKPFRQLTSRSAFPCEHERSVSTPTARASATSTPTATPTRTATTMRTATKTPTATRTPVSPACGLRAGVYRFVQVEGGTLQPAGLAPFPFPAGGSIVENVGPPDGACVHQTVVAFPGGFNVPTFCIPLLDLSVSVRQTGCGVGRIDSDGGSDFTVAEVGDTSSPTTCSSPHPGCATGIDAAARVDVTVGDGTPDACASGTANAVLTVPVETTVWNDAGGECPDPDGVFDPGTDALVLDFPQIFDLSTDATSADWQDIDPDGCCLAGAGPASVTNPCEPGGTGGLSANGSCIDLAARTVTLAASGLVSSSTQPLFDLTFTVELPGILQGPDDPSQVTCASPPPIAFDGTETRCLDTVRGAKSDLGKARNAVTRRAGLRHR